MSKHTSMSALLDRRASQVTRWHHRPVRQQETLADHQWTTAHIAFVIASVLQGEGWVVSLPLAVLYAMYHDMAETLLGDMPHPAKEIMGKAFLAAEREIVPRMFEDITDNVADDLRGFTLQARAWGSGLADSPIEVQIVEIADKMSALAFVNQEVMQGNSLFRSIRRHTAAGLLQELNGLPWGGDLYRLIPDMGDILTRFADEVMPLDVHQ